VILGDILADPTFPPLLRGKKLDHSIDPLQKAISAATLGEDPGTIFYNEDNETFRVAVILCPEETLLQSVGVTHAVMLALADSLGALGPPELAIHFEWPFGFKVNGAKCGQLQLTASTTELDSVPDWIAIGIQLPFIRPVQMIAGENPNQTWLHEEGCIELNVPQIIESWSRHLLIWLNTFQDDGYMKIQGHWRAKCDTIGEEINFPETGIFVGIDETGGLLMRKDGLTIIHCLTKQMTQS